MDSVAAVLVRFSRLVSEADATSEILPLLADAAMAHVGSDAAAVVQVQDGESSTVAVARGLPDALVGMRFSVDAFGAELGEALVAASRGELAAAHVLPMISGGGLFGSLVLLSRKRREVDPAAMDLAHALADLAATALGKAAQLEALRRAHDELRMTHEALARTEKLRALGQMAAGVSHDLKNILNPLSLHLQVIQRALARGQTADALESAGEMKQVLLRGVQTLERLRDYSRQSPDVRVESIDLDRVMEEAGDIARARAAASVGRAGVRIRKELAAPPRVMGHPGEIVSAVVNLVFNAIDAMPDGGTVTLRTGADGAGIWAAVVDDGPGMPPEIQRRVFEPFFTTKGQAGTGLGLAMVFACMQRHGGTVDVETAPGRGAKFTLRFPASAATG